MSRPVIPERRWTLPLDLVEDTLYPFVLPSCPLW